MDNMGSRIYSKRVELGLTQQELADKLGYTNKSAISRIERGLADIPSQKVRLFAEALETSESYLYGDAPKEAVSKTKKELIDLIQSLPDEVAEGLLAGLKIQLRK